LLSNLKPYTDKIIEPISNYIGKYNVSPNTITLFGLLISLISAYFYGKGSFITGAIFLALSGLCDLIDGNLARIRGKATDFGAFLDSTVDRLSDSVVYLGISIYFFEIKDKKMLLLSIVALIVSYTISYTRARAECIITDCKVGILERAERTLILIIFSIINKLHLGLYLIVTFGAITVIQRIYHTYRRTCN
jgi:CDP-diacylglycerol--glycerol-3-phosphate 3-phosphatidyltransferase